MDKKKKILAIASAGGHWIQLLRLKNAFCDADIVYVSTHKSFNQNNTFGRFYSVTDANRWNKLKLIKMAFEIRSIIKKENPNIIISTGAAPGLAAIFWGKLNGSKTIWIDSIANVEKISLSGRLARSIVDLHLTQWKELAKGKTKYYGTVIS